MCIPGNIQSPVHSRIPIQGCLTADIQLARLLNIYAAAVFQINRLVFIPQIFASNNHLLDIRNLIVSHIKIGQHCVHNSFFVNFLTVQNIFTPMVAAGNGFQRSCQNRVIGRRRWLEFAAGVKIRQINFPNTLNTHTFFVVDKTAVSTNH